MYKGYVPPREHCTRRADELATASAALLTYRSKGGWMSRWLARRCSGEAASGVSTQPPAVRERQWSSGREFHGYSGAPNVQNVLSREI